MTRAAITLCAVAFIAFCGALGGLVACAEQAANYNLETLGD